MPQKKTAKKAAKTVATSSKKKQKAKSKKATASKPAAKDATATAAPEDVPEPAIVKKAEKLFRVETDSLGDVSVPVEAYWGAQTQRAVENFPVSGRGPHRHMIRAYVAVKRSCAVVNHTVGKLDQRRSQAIIQACDEVLRRGLLMDQWVVDTYQAGAGTSMNMNTNEVLCNRALELMDKQRGQYGYLSPNDHVNMSQSTNDTFPTAMHIACLLAWADLRKTLEQLARVLSTKARIFDTVIKSGRTHLQDAVPIRLGQEFAAYAATIRDGIDTLDHAANSMAEVALGGSAVGTGFNTHERFASLAVAQLGKIINLPLRPARDLRQRMQSMLPAATLSAALRNLALELTRIANDLRLLSSGPRTGLAEIELPAVQPGSSIMPGKINPSMVECLNMICFQMIGNDTTVALAVQAGQLELNVMMPVIAAALLDSMTYLANFLPVFCEKCLAGITFNEEQCYNNFKNSVGMAAILNQKIGYLEAAKIAKRAVAENRSAIDIIRAEKLLSPKELKALLDKKAITEPGSIVAKDTP
jgi:aspartate ammonia-lyase